MSTARKTRRGWPGRAPGHSLDIAGRICDAYERVSDNPDEREQKSIRQQDNDWRAWMPGAGVIPGRVFADNDRSASDFAGKEREGFAGLRAYIESGRADGHVLWFWTSSRQTRGDIPLDTLFAESQAHGIVWAMGSEIINPANGRDRTNARLHYVMDTDFSWQLSANVMRGKEEAAKLGKPAAVPLYGYRRTYETDGNGQMVLIKGRPVIRGDEFNAADEHGNPVPGTPFAVVREIFGRLEALDTFMAIAVSLESRRVPCPRRPRKCTTCGEKMKKDDGWYCTRGHEQDLCQWKPSAVRFIASNEGYLGRRIFQAESGSAEDRRKAVLPGVEAKWPPLVDELQFKAVQAILGDAGRVRWRSPFSTDHDRSARREYLLVPVARCASCGGALGGHFEQGKDWYKCRVRGCSTIRADWLEQYAEDRLVSWLVLPEVQAEIRAGRSDAVTEAAEADLERETAAREALLTLARAGKAGDPELVAATMAGITERMAEAEDKLRPAVSTALAGLFGDEVADRWVALKAGDLTAARRLMAEVATIYVRPAASRGGGASRGFDEARVEWHWNIGQAASTPPTRLDRADGLAERKAALAAARERAAKLLTADPSQADAAIGRAAGCAYGTVGRIRAQLTAAGTITDPGYRQGIDGKRYMSSGNGKPGSPRVSASEGTARRPARRGETGAGRAGAG